MKKMELWLTALRIERVWKKIGRNRALMGGLIENREPYTSERLVALDLKNHVLWDEALRLQEKYLALSNT